MTPPRFDVHGTVISCPDPRALASFYEGMLGWSRIDDQPDWVVLGPDAPGPRLSFHIDGSFEAPVWPSSDGRQQMQLHLDIATDDLGAAVERACALGAKVAEDQPQDDVRVMLDPVGHPFCLFVPPVGG